MDDDKAKSNKEVFNKPRLVCQKLILVVPLQFGGRHSGELAVEHGLLIPQHHHVLRRDHRPWETLICKGKKRRTNIGAMTRANHQTIKSHMCGCSTMTKGATVSFIKTCQSQRKVVKKRELSQLWVLTAWTAWKIAEWLFVINLRLKVHHHTFRT